MSETAVAGNNIPNGFLSGITQGGSAAGGAGEQGGANRARIGDFSKFTSNSGEFEGQAAEAQRRMKPLMDSPIANREPFRETLGEDAQSLALTVPDEHGEVDDAVEGEVLEGEELAAERARLFHQYSEWEKLDDLAEPLMTKLVPVTVNGERYRIPVSEAAGGFMMQQDYSDKLRQLYEFKAQIEARERGMNNFLAALDKGATFLEMMGYLGKFEGFAQAAIIYGTQLDAEQRMTPEQREVVSRERAARARAHQLEIELNQLKAQMQQQQQPQRSRTEEYYIMQLKQMVPTAIARLEKRGIKWESTQWADEIFEAHWRNMLPAIDGKDLTTDHVFNVLMAAAQEIQRRTAAGQVRAPKPGAAAALPPVSGLQGPTQPGPRRQKRARIGDISQVHR